MERSDIEGSPYGDSPRSGYRPGAIISDDMDDDFRLYEGMQVILEGQPEGCRLMWIDDHRDRGHAVVMDWDGHSAWVEDIRDGSWRVLEEGTLAYRVLYGETKDDVLHVSDSYYSNLEEFRRIVPGYAFSVLLGCTARYVYPSDK